MIITALLVRDTKGWYELEQAGEDRKEAFLSLGSLDREDSRRAALFQLGVFRYPRIEITADIEPNGSTGDLPFLQFGVGDRVTVPAMGGGTSTEVVQSLTLTADDVGNVDFGMTVKDPFLEHAERVERVLAKANDGSFVGRTPVATPPQRLVTESTRSRPAPVPFADASGTLTTGAYTSLGRPDKIGAPRKAVLDVFDDAGDPVAGVEVNIEFPFDPSNLGGNVIGTVTTLANGHGEVDLTGTVVDPGSGYGATLEDDAGGFQTIDLVILH